MRWLASGRALLIVVALVLSIGVTAGATEQPATSEARIFASLAPGSGLESVPAQLVVTPAGGKDQRIPFQVPGEIDLPGADPHSTLRLEAPGFWSRISPAAPGEVHLRLHPLARIKGMVSTSGRGGLPDSLRLFLDGETLLAPAILDCPVAPGGRYVCEGPAGHFDLQVRSHGFAPRFLWDVDLVPRRDNALPQVALQPGASISGFVERADGSPLGKGVIVHLAPQVLKESGSRDGPKGKPLSVLERATKPEARGVFVFADVPPGQYDLEAGEPGWTAGRLAGVEVLEGSETHLSRPLEITRPVPLQVQLFPGLAPSGSAWRVRVIGQNAFRGSEPLVGTCDEQGYVEFPALPEDTYKLVAEDPDNGQPFEEREVEVAAPLTFVEWDLPLVAVEGTVHLGRKPIPAKLTFGPASMASRNFQADDEGRFQGVLSRAGDWEVLVESKAHDVSRWLRGVEVPEPARPGEVVDVALKLPDSEINGLVVDEEYRPIQAQVIVEPLGSRDRSNGVVSKPNGSFVVRGLPAGAIELFATTQDHRTSSIVSVDLPPDGVVGSIQLRVEKKRDLRGSVQSGDGPVRGARIALRGAGSPLYMSTTAVATTDARGTFSMEIPAALREAQLEIRAPGHPLTVRRVALGDSLALSLEAVWGTAEVDWAPELNERLWAMKDGASWSFSQLVNWALAYPGEGEALSGHTTVPRLEPGIWYVCAPLPGSPEWVQIVAFGVPGRSCKRLEVTAWGTAVATMRAVDEEKGE